MSKSKVKTFSCMAVKRRSCTARPEMRVTWRALAGAQSQKTETRCPEKLNIAKMPLKIHNASPSLLEIYEYTSEKMDRRFLKSGLGPLGDQKPSQVIQTCRHQMGPVSRIALSLCIHTHISSVLYFYYLFLHQPHIKKVCMCAPTHLSISPSIHFSYLSVHRLCSHL